MNSTARLSLPLIAASQSQKEVSHNGVLARLDALAHLVFLDRDLSAPTPASNGDICLAASSATGAWAGQDVACASYADGFGTFDTPVIGLVAFVADEGTLEVYASAGGKGDGALLSDVAPPDAIAIGS